MKQVIMEAGLTVGQAGHISIDPALWTTQAALSKKLKVSRNTVNNRVRRYLQNGLLPDYYIESLGVRLIPNVNTLNELANYRKK